MRGLETLGALLLMVGLTWLVAWWYFGGDYARGYADGSAAASPAAELEGEVIPAGLLQFEDWPHDGPGEGVGGEEPLWREPDDAETLAWVQDMARALAPAAPPRETAAERAERFARLVPQ